MLPKAFTAFCSVSECVNAARKAGLCWGHFKRRQRGQSANGELRPSVMTPDQVLTEAALAYAEADVADDGAFQRAWDRLRKAAAIYTRRKKRANQHARGHRKAST